MINQLQPSNLTAVASHWLSTGCALEENVLEPLIRCLSNEADRN